MLLHVDKLILRTLRKPAKLAYVGTAVVLFFFYVIASKQNFKKLFVPDY